MYQSVIKVALITALLLLIPLIAMQFTEEVNWDLADFVVMGVLLFGTGLTYQLVARKMSNITYRYIVSAIVIVVFLLIWAELAVGIFGTPFAGS